MENIKHLAQLLKSAAESGPASSGYRFKTGGRFIQRSWKECWQSTLEIAHVLWRMGVQPRSKVALLSENRPEWLMVDMASYCLNAVTVPIYVTSAPSEVRHVLSDSQARVFVVSKPELLQPLEEMFAGLDQVWAILLIEGEPPGDSRLGQRIFKLSEERSRPDQRFRDLVAKNIEGDHRSRLATIIYTSGTTGTPKGVMLSHGNFLANAEGVSRALHFDHRDLHLSFLPLSHVFERVCGYYLMLYRNASIAYAESAEVVGRNILEVHPTLILAVPRFYEKVCRAIESKVAALSPARKAIFAWARRAGERGADGRYRGVKISLWEKLQWFLATLLVFRKIQKQLGGNVRHCVSGGAALPEEIARSFYAMGILIIEGYGLTETSPVIAVNRQNRFKFGCVGLPLDGVGVRIASDGEILTKGDSVMQGYYHRDEATREAIRDGWFHTGDLGELDGDGFLKITGRKKEMIVTSSGKNVCTERVESVFQKDPLITRCVLYGEGKSFLTALIVPDADLLTEMARGDGQSATSAAEISNTDWARQKIQQALDKAHRNLAPYEQVKYFHVLHEDFTIEKGELTPTLKLRRRVVHKVCEKFLNPYYEKHGQVC